MSDYNDNYSNDSPTKRNQQTSFPQSNNGVTPSKFYKKNTFGVKKEDAHS